MQRLGRRDLPASTAFRATASSTRVGIRVVMRREPFAPTVIVTEAPTAAGLPRHLPPQNLRHTCASIHGQLGTPVTVVSAMLGHSNVRTTLDCYTHAFGSMHEAAADAMDRALEGAAR